MNDTTPLSERVASFYRQLSAVAVDLNAVSDELGKSIDELNLALRKLNLGVSAWVELRGYGDPTPSDTSYWSEDLGYAKVGSRWGIALRRVSGDYNCPDQESVESWEFNDAPRLMRLLAIEKMPQLLEALSKEAVETTAKIKRKLAEVQEVAAVVKKAAHEPKRVSLKPSPFAADRDRQEQEK